MFLGVSLITGGWFPENSIPAKGQTSRCREVLLNSGFLKCHSLPKKQQAEADKVTNIASRNGCIFHTGCQRCFHVFWGGLIQYLCKVP